MRETTALMALGAMSGTSLDGVDVAAIETDGHRIIRFGDHAYRAYTQRERAVLRAALGHWPEDDVRAALDLLHAAHLELMSALPADLAGVHGQTLAHDPGGRGTHQLGDGAVLAQELGMPVVWDFRSEDVLAGGQGAPLAPFFHFACAQWIGAKEPVAFLNLGGVGNLSWVDPSRDAPELPGALLAFDTGPANAPINDLVHRRTGAAFDADGALARAGTPDMALVARFLEHPYFLREPPKSLDRDEFSELGAMVDGLHDADAAATLTAAAVASVVAGLQHCPSRPSALYVTGGGRRNPVIMDALRQGVEFPVAAVEDVGLNGDMLEAQAFGFLAVRVLRGLPTAAPATTGADRPTGGGRISYPTPV